MFESLGQITDVSTSPKHLLSKKIITLTWILKTTIIAFLYSRNYFVSYLCLFYGQYKTLNVIQKFTQDHCLNSNKY